MKRTGYYVIVVAVLVGLTGWTAVATAQRSAPTIAAWEYRKVVLLTSPGEQLNTLYVDDKVVSSTPLSQPAPSVLGTAQTLGTEGWELVSTTSVPRGVDLTLTLWFKRQR
jgi:hypothetical protein